MSVRPNPFVAAVIVSLAVCACEPRPLSIALEGPPPFDPTRVDVDVPDAGVMPDRLVFAVTPFFSPVRQEPLLLRLGAYLTEKTGVPVTAHVTESYEAAVIALERGEADVSLLSPFSYVRAQERIKGLVPLATAVAQGSTTYASYLVVMRASGIETVSDVRQKRVGLVDKLSTSGHVLPRAWLLAHGIDIDRDVTITWHGSHDAVLAALKRGEIDVAALSSDTLVNDDAIGLAGPVRILAKTGRVPYDAVVARPGLSPRAVALLRRAFLTLSIHDEAGRAVLKDESLINGFMPISPGHYDDVARAGGGVP
jgi:phosphonate transport system substrate-binding protein